MGAGGAEALPVSVCGSHHEAWQDGSTYRLDMDGREKILEHGRHEFELLVFAAKPRQDELRVDACHVSVPARVRDAQGSVLTKGASANSLPTARGRLAIRRTSLASE